MTHELTIVIPTFNRAHHLARALEALEAQDVPAGTFDVVVTDDGSTDGTPDVLARSYPFEMRALRQPNTGPGAARNAAIRYADGAYLLFIDDDVIPARDLVREHLDAQAGTPGVVIGRLIAPASRRLPVWAEWETRTLDKQYDDMLAGHWSPTPRQFYTANASVPRLDVIRAGQFDASFERAEDVELAYRLADLGLPFRFVPTAIVVHDTPRTLRAWMRMARQYGRYDVVMWRDKGRAHIISNIAHEYRFKRNPVLRGAARVLVGRGALICGICALLPVAVRGSSAIGARRAALSACSAVFNLLYWHAACEELGGRAAFWAGIERELRQASIPAGTVEA